MCSVLDPLCEIRSQACAAGGQSVVVIGPFCNLAVVRPHDGHALKRDWNCPREPAEVRLYQRGSNRPFHDHAITTHENRVGLPERVGIELSRLLEEFRQPLFVVEVQVNSVIFESEFLCSG